jgi:hypothetical protein
MEHNWMKAIPSESICNFFYFFFVFYAVIAIITVLGTIGVLAFLRLPKGLMLMSGFQSLVVAVLAATMALFHYLICDRALLATKGAPRVQGALESNPDMLQ